MIQCKKKFNKDSAFILDVISRVEDLNKIDIFKESLNSGNYPWAKEEDSCTFCGFRKICRRKEENGTDTD